ncbi:unnamed protein product [Parascedosporium putredinis]|uniref:cAMP-independent regulatory protein pac2 n=1 Tax=Parascedosporium putredinis TaxID=1442378 RepID=A0A9P1MDQ1_9PEZI|nr:unnamed protein product [Parascedosporium putredinis]CAI8000054.1 unnamed protein product [Parascedosporium putredinis]
METYFGLVRTPADAIKLFEACRLGVFPRVQRRLSEKERQSIRSGSVFVWDEREAGMRRWTDGKSWSASRVSGSFLTYREMEGKRGGGFNSQRKTTGKTPESGRGSDEDHDDGEPEGYRYKADGLMKQSFSITTSTGQHLHLISYFTKSHSQSSDLPQPSTDPQLRHIMPAKGLYPESSWSDSTAAPALARAAMTTGHHASTHYSTAPRMSSRRIRWPLLLPQAATRRNLLRLTDSLPGDAAPPAAPSISPSAAASLSLADDPHHAQHSPHTPHYPPTPQMQSHMSQAPPHFPTSRPMDSPVAQHLQAAAAQAVLNTGGLAPHSTTPPARTLSVSPPRSARSDTASAQNSSSNTSYAPSAMAQTPNLPPNKASLSALLLHPCPRLPRARLRIPRVGGCMDGKSMTEDARALRVLDRKFCI